MTAKCYHDTLEVFQCFENLVGPVFTCPECQKAVILEYDEIYDPDDGDTQGWFYWEEKK